MPRDGSATRTRILDAAEKLVEQQGFAATSVDQILGASRSSKGAFFHHFASKRELAHALVARYVDADLAMLDDGLVAASAVADPGQRVLAFLRYYEDWAETLVGDTACLYIAMLAERDLLDETTSAEMDRAIKGWRDEFAALLRPALAGTELRAPLDVDELADHLFATFEGAYLMCRCLDSAEPMRAQLRVFRSLIENLLARTRVTS
jgi:TetR/AcrR family transcriptional repressor of nem operon